MNSDNPLLYVVLLGLILIVFSRFLPKSASSSPSRLMVKEMEESLDQFGAEMEEQNRVLIELFSETKREYELQITNLAGRLETLERQNAELSRQFGRLAHDREGALLQARVAALHGGWSDPMTGPGQQAAAAQQTAAPQARGSENLIEGSRQPDEKVSLIHLKIRYAELFSYHEAGKSVDYIAKKLGMNKGEVGLILQLSRQEDKLNA